MTAPSLFGDDASERNSPETTTKPTPSLDAQTTSAPVSLYRSYRPQSFSDEEIVGQDHVVRTLRNAIALDRVAHAYLFSGPRGTGKTTTARLLAKAINCLDPDPSQRPCNKCQNCTAINSGAATDIVEIDAASNRGIDDIRDLRERVRYAPAQLPSKVYIIDEAHQITGAAANAFLKTLEEPPSHTRFVLATTDPEELLPTIVSRCQRFEFRRIPVDAMIRRLRTVAARENISVEPDALRAIARQATGSLRDALGLLEQLAIERGVPERTEESSTIRAEDVQAALGLSRNDRIESLTAALAKRQTGDALRVVQDAVDAGEDPRQLNKQFLAYLRLLLHERSGAATGADEHARSLAAEFSLEQLAAHARRFGEIDFSIKHAPYPQLPLEVALVEATSAAAERGVDSQPVISDRSDDSDRERANGAQRTSLRERVRNPAVTRESITSAESPDTSRPAATVTPIRATTIAPAAAPAPAPSATDAAAITVERLVDLWPHVRADVKVLNRRVEALLSEVDPVSITGNLITLAVPYPFHRDKLNSDDVRDTISSVLSRHLKRDVVIDCVLRGEVALPSGPGRALTETIAAVSESDPAAAPSEEEQRAIARIQAAKNIFDAEEIEPIAAVHAASPASDA